MPKGSESATSSGKLRKTTAPHRGEVRPSSKLFVLPDLPDPVTLDQRLPGLSFQVTASAALGKFAILDCHDQSLRTSGRLLLDCSGDAHLFDASGLLASQRCKPRDKFAADLPDGALKSALSGFPELRALTCIGEGQMSRAAIAVLDDLQKTQVRGNLLDLRTESGHVVIIQLEPLRGYDRAHARVSDMLASMTGSTPEVAAICPQLFPDQRPYQAKPDVLLGKTEPAIQVATDIIHTFLNVARQNESGIVADLDTEFLHDYRVSLRRVRSVLSLFKGVYSEAQTAQLKQEFSELMSPTGRLRDLDVYLLEKQSFFNIVPATLHAGLDEMFNRFQAERKRTLARLTRQFRSAAYEEQMRRLTDLFSDVSHLEPGPNADLGAFEYARSLIWKRYRKVCKLARGITPETPDEAVHDLRIHCKKLRYLMEFFAPLFDRGTFKKIIKPLKRLQDNLGLFSDCAVQQLALLEFVQRQPAGRADSGLSMGVGGVIAVLDQKQRSERNRVISNFEHFDSPDIRHLFRALFHNAKE